MADRLSERAMQSGWVRFFNFSFKESDLSESELSYI